MTTPEAVIAEARRWVGYHEGANNDTPFGKEYGMNHAAWCDMFLTHCFKLAGNTEEHFASTMEDVAYHRARGTFGNTPRVGAKIFFHWNNSKRAANQPDHVGIVERIAGDGVHTLEGNAGDAVQANVRRANILGYAYPNYSGAQQAPTPQAPPAQAGGLVEDGELGPATISALQRRLNDTEPGPDLAVDGDMNQLVVNRTVTFKRGATQTARYLQQRLNWGAGPCGIDGEPGPQTIKALQRYVGVGQDGQWGAQTTTALQRKLNSGSF